jgi:putative transcriptional regulator
MEIEVRVKIQELLDEYNLSYRELSRLTDINRTTLCLLSQQKRQKVQLSHIKSICEALEITDPRKIFEFHMKEA